MWSTYIGQAWMLYQPTLHWESPDGSFKLGYSSQTLAATGYPLVDVYLPQTVRGADSFAGAACAAFSPAGASGTARTATLRLGTRYGARWSVKENDGANPTDDGFWFSHNYNSRPYVEFQIVDGETVVDSVIVHSGLTSSSPLTLLCGFCEVDGEWRFIAWMHTPLRNDSRAPYGAGTAFLSTAVNVADLFDGPAQLSGAFLLLSAAEKHGPYESLLSAIPDSPESLLQNAGSRLASLRSHHANAVMLANQSIQVQATAPYLRVPEVDIHGHYELRPDGFFEQNRVFIATSMAYKLWDVGSYLPSGTTSHVHHDAAVNQRLSSVTVSLSNVVSSQFWEGELSVSPITCTAIPKSLNQCSGSGESDYGPAHALVGISRRDGILPLQPTSYETTELQNEYIVQVTCKFAYDSNPLRYQRMNNTAVLTAEQASAFLAGDAISLPFVIESGSGTLELQAVG